MSFTITRQVEIDPQLQSTERGGGSSLGELLGTAVAGRVIGNLFTPRRKKTEEEKVKEAEKKQQKREDRERRKLEREEQKQRRREERKNKKNG